MWGSVGSIWASSDLGILPWLNTSKNTAILRRGTVSNGGEIPTMTVEARFKMVQNDQQWCNRLKVLGGKFQIKDLSKKCRLKDQELWVCQRKKTEAPKTMGIKATNAKRLGFSDSEIGLCGTRKTIIIMSFLLGNRLFRPPFGQHT